MPETRILETAHGTRIAYKRTKGKGPGVVFLPGFMSDMEGGKATALEAWCVAEGQAFVRFDYQGHGVSEGKFADGTIGLWAKDAIAVIDKLTEGPQIVVGSSMGGWIGLLAAKARPGRVKAFVGLAAAPDFTVRMWEGFDEATRAEVLENGFMKRPCDYGDEPYTITKALIDDGWQNRVLNAPIHLDIPVRLIQGTLDPDVPWQTAQQIADCIVGENTEVILVPGGDHRLSRDIDLKRLTRMVGELTKDLPYGR
ncbi:alpha/beta fold hydrolase [Kordiimonas pumila]|uniref:Palmitoyl-protein thioesterase ABHD10, mitochondrial n=1 Tax=Kordiimonas pumila TaxID=2161677 RepID=A0ABV7D4T8_9PROT|nr:alpha/beta hydrolase [Kordiimonas pumila]